MMRLFTLGKLDLKFLMIESTFFVILLKPSLEQDGGIHPVNEWSFFDWFAIVAAGCFLLIMGPCCCYYKFGVSKGENPTNRLGTERRLSNNLIHRRNEDTNASSGHFTYSRTNDYGHPVNLLTLPHSLFSSVRTPSGETARRIKKDNLPPSYSECTEPPPSYDSVATESVDR